MAHAKIVITKTPFRMSFLGGGTDFPDYFNQREGAVLSTTIDKYLYVTINSLQRFYEKRIRLSYSKLEQVDSLYELHHEIVREVLKHHPHFEEGNFLDMHTFADFPASSGVGSSSAFTVGFLNALYYLQGVFKTPEALAYEAIDLEREKLKDVGGWQDQVAAAFGGLNLIRFKHNTFSVEQITLSLDCKEALESSCLLFFTGGTRSSSEIQQGALSKIDEHKIKQLDMMAQQALEGVMILQTVQKPTEMLHEFGALLNQAWEIKRGLSKNISNTDIDRMYEVGIKAGALGGKLCGAGGHGFLLLLTSEEKKQHVIEALSQYKFIDIKLTYQGSHSIYASG